MTHNSDIDPIARMETTTREGFAWVMIAGLSEGMCLLIAVIALGDGRVPALLAIPSLLVAIRLHLFCSKIAVPNEIEYKE